MPHVGSNAGGEDLGSEDEVKVFKDEGEDEKRSSENLTEEKSSLIDLTESEEKCVGVYVPKAGGVGGSTTSLSSAAAVAAQLRAEQLSNLVFGKVEPTAHTSTFNMGYLVPPYPYGNPAGGPIPVSMASKIGLAGTHPAAGLSFFCSNGDHLTQPPPAHMGIPPYGALDAGKAAAAAAAGLTSRSPMYPFATGQYPYPMLSPDMTQVAASWHTPSMYAIPGPAGAGFRSPYPTSLPIASPGLSGDLYRFSPTGLIGPHPGLSPHHAHALAATHALVTSSSSSSSSAHHHPKTEQLTVSSCLDHEHHGGRSSSSSSIDQKNSSLLSHGDSKSGLHHHQHHHQHHHHDNNGGSGGGGGGGPHHNQESISKKKNASHIKKPLNAFMLYMKEMRAKVVAECTLKESAAINQILGRRWHSLTREEQQRYYEQARHERQLHQQRYPGWSARDNYGYGSKKKKRKKERSTDPSGGNNAKKCRARYGLDQQSQWCKPCRRKKKCIRYMGDGGDGDYDGDGGEPEDEHSEYNPGSVGDVGLLEDEESLSSPGGLSGLSSPTSPSLVMPSPSSLASPCPLTPQSQTQQHQQQQHQQNNNQNQQSHQHHQQHQAHQEVPGQPATPHRNPVGTNPHDINNPLSVNQLTGQCIKT